MDAALEFAGLLYEMAVTIYFEARRIPAEEGIDDCSEPVEHYSPISNRPFMSHGFSGKIRWTLR
jgi:hypothetical protein